VRTELTGRIDEFTSVVDESFSRVYREMRGMEGRLGARIDSVRDDSNKRFATIDETLTRHERRFTKLESQGA
jgi:hypothetical protein